MDSLNDLTDLRLLSLGGSAVTLGGLLTALVILVLAWVLARVVGAGLERLRGRARVGRSSIYIVQRLVTYAIVLAGVLVALTNLGINLTSLAVFAGALGVGLGLGLQGIVREFVSGLVVIFERHANVGDFIELENGTRGLIVEVGPRATRIKTNDNVDIIIPNSKLIENQVTNWTLKGDTRRIHVPFSAAYGADKNQVREVVLEAARAVPFTLADTETRRTQVWLTGFGDSALNFELVVWPTIDAVKRPAAMQAAYAWAIEDALTRAGIEIPFPQMDIRLRSLFGREEEKALDALRLERAPETEPPEEIPPANNDAADDLMANAKAAEQAKSRVAKDDHEGRAEAEIAPPG
ncbi:MAG TPA: mechanosensitive ion channel domain-containing protein [Caulobacteraceae bacterium]|jgi:small-conductance mechanosensitive channel